MIVYNPENCSSRTDRYNKQPRISFLKTGLVILNEAAVHGLNLKSGDKIDLVQDEDRPKDWYLRIRETGFILRPKDTKHKAILKFASIVLVKKIQSSLGIDHTFSVPVAIKPSQDMYAIITSSINK